MYIYQSKAMFCLFARALVRAGRLKRTKWGSDLQTIIPSIHFLSFTCVCDTRNLTPGLCYERAMMRLNSQTNTFSQRSARIKRVKLKLSNT
jgi:hypothetical protein